MFRKGTYQRCLLAAFTRAAQQPLKPSRHVSSSPIVLNDPTEIRLLAAVQSAEFSKFAEHELERRIGMQAIRLGIPLLLGLSGVDPTLPTVAAAACGAFWFTHIVYWRPINHNPLVISNMRQFPGRRLATSVKLLFRCLLASVAMSIVGFSTVIMLLRMMSHKNMEAACLALETLCEVYPEWWNAVATTLARPPGTPLAIRFSHFAFKVEDPAMKAVTRRVATDLIEQASTDAKAGRPVPPNRARVLLQVQRVRRLSPPKSVVPPLKQDDEPKRKS